MTDESTTRFSLPLLAAGQAQKEMTHNEALALVDLLLHATVQAVDLDAPPAAPEAGQCWIVGGAPEAAWAGHARHLACWTAGGWRFLAPREGLRVWVEGSALGTVFRGGQWLTGVVAATRVEVGGQQVLGSRAGAVPPPAGGAVIDAEARGAISAIVQVLVHHGLVAS